MIEPERHPTYFEARNVLQRVADMMVAVEHMHTITEHGETVSLSRVCNDAVGELFRLQQIAERADVKTLLAGTHVAMPKEPPQEVIERGLDALCNQSHEDNAPEIGDALEYLDLSAVYVAMVEAAQREREMTAPESALDILIAAREWLSDRKHWTTRVSWRAKNGKKTLHRDLVVSTSAIGAIMLASGQERNGDERSQCAIAARKAVVALGSYTKSIPIAIWNDAPTTTHADVLLAFDRAIEAVRKAQ